MGAAEVEREEIGLRLRLRGVLCREEVRRKRELRPVLKHRRSSRLILGCRGYRIFSRLPNGSVASRFRLFSAQRLATVVPNRRAMPHSVSPDRTV